LLGGWGGGGNLVEGGGGGGAVHGFLLGVMSAVSVVGYSCSFR